MKALTVYNVARLLCFVQSTAREEFYDRLSVTISDYIFEVRCSYDVSVNKLFLSVQCSSIEVPLDFAQRLYRLAERLRVVDLWYHARYAPHTPHTLSVELPPYFGEDLLRNLSSEELQEDL